MTNVSTSTPAPAAAPAPDRPSIGRRLIWLGPTGIVVAVGLSVLEWMVVRDQPAGTVLAALLALLMTAPVLLARRFPVQAAAVIAIAAILNGLLIDDLVRCAGAFPAAVYIAFSVGARAREGGRSWSWPIGGLGLVLAALIAQWIWDPALNVGPGFLAFGPPLAVVAWGVGLGWSALSPRLRRAAAAA